MRLEMGYFTNLFLLTSEADDSGVSIETSVYAGPVDEPAYFMWGEGTPPDVAYSFASGTLFTNLQLNLIYGYPRRERHPACNSREERIIA
jgi:hypothetical protein